MTELLGGKLSPITNTIGFLRRNKADAVNEFALWQKDIQARRGVSIVTREVSGDLEAVIRQLLPLTSVERRRFLFIPTPSNWTAFIDNGHQGTDVFSPLSYLAEKLRCEAVRATAILDGGGKQYPATIFELFGPARADFLNYVRSVATAYDGRKWSFSAEGEVQPFEQVDRYADRSVQMRFTPEMLDSYLRSMQISAFEEEFYLSEDATLVEKVGPIAPAAREYHLSDVQPA
jgi:hypothetical protein